MRSADLGLRSARRHADVKIVVKVGQAMIRIYEIPFVNGSPELLKKSHSQRLK
jgi:hypothetical protein